MEDLPTDVPALLVPKIRIDLRRIHARFLDLKTSDVHIRAAYDVYASNLLNAGHTLTDDFLHNRIPLWVIHWAILKEWIPYPEYRHIDNAFITPSGVALSRPELFPIPEGERTIVVEPYRITEERRDYLVKFMSGRIVHWETEALLAAPFLVVPGGAQSICKRKEAVETFLVRCNAVSRERIRKRHIWRSIGHLAARQFEYWQACDDKATRADDTNFSRIFRMSPEEFIESLYNKKLIKSDQ